MITLGQLLPSLDPVSKIIITNEEGYPVPLTKEDTVTTLSPRCFDEMDTSYIIPLLDSKVKTISHHSEFLEIILKNF
jgi:hypothetical protein